jgi:hypothetical protein
MLQLCRLSRQDTRLVRKFFKLQNMQHFVTLSLTAIDLDNGFASIPPVTEQLYQTNLEKIDEPHFLG